MEGMNEMDVGRLSEFLLCRIDSIHFASIILLDTIKSIDRCEDLEDKAELLKDRDRLIKSIVNLSSMEV